MISSAQLACLLIRIRSSTISFPFEYNFESYLWYIDLEYELFPNFGNITALSMKVTWFHGLLGLILLVICQILRIILSYIRSILFGSSVVNFLFKNCIYSWF